MQLNLDIIREHLPGGWHCEAQGPAERGLDLGRPLLYSPDGAVRPGRVYVAQAETLPPSPPKGPAAWICTGGPRPAAWRADGARVLWVAAEAGAVDVYNAVQEVYDALDAWDGALRDELEREEDFSLERFLAVGARVLENHIGVADQFLQVVCSTSLVDGPDGAEVRVSRETFPMTLGTGEQVRALCAQEGARREPFLSALLWKGCRLYCSNLFPLGHYIGTVYVAERHRPFRSGDFALADHFFGYFQRAFLKYLRGGARAKTPGAAVLCRLLEGQPLCAGEQQRLALRPGERWVWFRLERQRAPAPMPQDAMCAMLQAMMPQTVYPVLWEGALQGLVRVQGESAGPQGKELAAFGEIVGRMGYTGGCSGSFASLDQLDSGRAQAGYAAQRCAAGQTLCFFQEQLLPYLLAHGSGGLPPEALCPPGLLRLREYDRRHGTEYMKTLGLYLKNERRASQTAKQLYIQRSSLLKRLERIRRLTGIDLDDPDARLLLRLCLALLERGAGEDA